MGSTISQSLRGETEKEKMLETCWENKGVFRWEKGEDGGGVAGKGQV